MLHLMCQVGDPHNACELDNVRLCECVDVLPGCDKSTKDHGENSQFYGRGESLPVRNGSNKFVSRGSDVVVTGR